MLILSIIVPVLLGFGILLVKEWKSRTLLLSVTGAALAVTAALGLGVVFGAEAELFLFSFGKNLDFYLRVDTLGRLFALVLDVVWLLSGFYAFEYMKHEQEEKRFFGFFVMVFGVLHALAFSGSMVTFYLFYELMTLLSVPLILHSRSKDAIKGGLKYLFYSLFGAYMVLFGLFFLNRFAQSFTFQPGGTLNMAAVAGNEGLMLVVAFSMILGFSVKAGMFPLHAWLPTAHPVAPAPASAVMSGIIVKMGVLGMIRVVYYLIGADFLRGTWVQTTWMSLSLVTVFMGSMLAYREKVMKKRLAYSTVSQASYILFGLSLLQPQAMTGALTSGIDVFSWLGPVVLLTSALLTAGYLLPITVNGFLPGADYDYDALEKKEPCMTMLLPLLILAALAVVLGIFPNPLTAYISEIAAGVL